MKWHLARGQHSHRGLALNFRAYTYAITTTAALVHILGCGRIGFDSSPGDSGPADDASTLSAMGDQTECGWSFAETGDGTFWLAWVAAQPAQFERELRLVKLDANSDLLAAPTVLVRSTESLQVFSMVALSDGGAMLFYGRLFDVIAHRFDASMATISETVVIGDARRARAVPNGDGYLVVIREETGSQDTIIVATDEEGNVTATNTTQTGIAGEQEAMALLDQPNGPLLITSRRGGDTAVEYHRIGSDTTFTEGPQEIANGRFNALSLAVTNAGEALVWLVGIDEGGEAYVSRFPVDTPPQAPTPSQIVDNRLVRPTAAVVADGDSVLVAQTDDASTPASRIILGTIEGSEVVAPQAVSPSDTRAQCPELLRTSTDALWVSYLTAANGTESLHIDVR